MTAEGKVEKLQRWYRTYNAEGLEGAEEMLGDLFDPQVEFSPPLAREVEGRAYRGHDGLRVFFRELTDTLGEVRYDSPEYHPAGDNAVVMLTRLVGTGRGSRVPVEQDMALVFEFHDGLVRKLTAYGSRNEAFRAAEEAQRA